MTLSANHVAEKNKLHSTSSWVYLVELRHSDSEAYRLAQYTRNVTFGGNVYYAFPFEVSGFPSSTESGSENIVLTFSDPARVLTAAMEPVSGFVDDEVVITLAHMDHLADGSALQSTYRIAKTDISWGAVAMTLGGYELFATDLPRQRFLRDKCRHTYRTADGTIGATCGYQETSTGAGLPTCDKTLNGPNGCVVHGDDEVANGFERLHPGNFGAFPGILKNRS